MYFVLEEWSSSKHSENIIFHTAYYSICKSDCVNINHLVSAYKMKAVFSSLYLWCTSDLMYYALRVQQLRSMSTTVYFCIIFSTFLLTCILRRSVYSWSLHSEAHCKPFSFCFLIYITAGPLLCPRASSWPPATLGFASMLTGVFFLLRFALEAICLLKSECTQLNLKYSLGK